MPAEHGPNNSENSHTCCICRNLDENSRFPFRKDDIRADGLRYSRTLGDVKTTKPSCRFCFVLFSVVEYFSDDLSDSTSFRIDLWGRHTELRLYNPRVDIEIYSPLGAPVAWRNIPVLKDIEPNPASDKSFAFVENLLQACNENHVLCKRNSSILPKRVLDVANLPIKLIETNPESIDPYVALSYCWGPNPNFTTTLSSLSERMSGIELSLLPAAISDAVSWTRRMGLRYLWIDALCIIQDSAADWEIESAKMASIYENAYVTVCAASSPACDEPFLFGRKRSYITIKCLDESGKSTIVKARKLPRTGIHDWSGSIPDVWDMRCWTMQEKILSTRLVSYSGEEIQWKCKTMETCECKRGVPSNSIYAKSISKLESSRDAYVFWHGQVVEYTRRRLTCAPDKLPAISGIASMLQLITGSKYIAGLWEGNLINDLCWERVDVGEGEKSRPSWIIPSAYRAPSFSWASVDGAVFYNEDCLSPDWTAHALVVDTCVKLAGNNIFGAVEYASIGMRGPCLLGALSSRNSSPASIFPYYDFDDADGETHEFLADVVLQQCGVSVRRATSTLDTSFEKVPVQAVSLGHIRYQDEEETWYVQYCLVVGRFSKESAAYERLGLISFYRGDEWDWKAYLRDAADENIKLV